MSFLFGLGLGFLFGVCFVIVCISPLQYFFVLMRDIVKQAIPYKKPNK